MPDGSREVKIEPGERVILDKNRTMTNHGTETVFIEPPLFTPVGDVEDEVMAEPSDFDQPSELPRERVEELPDNFALMRMQSVLMPTLAEAKARLAMLEIERGRLRAFIRYEERLAKKHPTGTLKGME
jgi:hypothetical protein